MTGKMCSRSGLREGSDGGWNEGTQKINFWIETGLRFEKRTRLSKTTVRSNVRIRVRHKLQNRAKEVF